MLSALLNSAANTTRRINMPIPNSAISAAVGVRACRQCTKKFVVLRGFVRRRFDLATPFMVCSAFLGSLALFKGFPTMPELLTVRQLAKRLNLSSWAIYQAVKDGTLPGRRLRPRGRLYFSEPEVMDALKPDARIRELMAEAQVSIKAV
jgi:excisionase family DNA binding protein